MPKQQHELYTDTDFNDEERESRNQLYVNVVEGGLGVCKKCGAAEQDLLDFDNCTDYIAWAKRDHSYQMEKIHRKHDIGNNLEEIDIMLQMLRDDIDYPKEVKERCINKLEHSRVAVLKQQEILEALPAELPRSARNTSGK